MNANQLIMGYLVISVVVWFGCYSLARRFSGVNFKERWFWICLAFTIVVGGFHLETFRNGYFSIAGRRIIIVEDSFAVELISLFGIAFQVVCIPSKYEPRQWFSKRK